MRAEEDDLAQALREAGLRRTRARMQVLALLSGRHDHPTADQLAETLRERGERVGVATLYQNLSRLNESGVIGCIKGADGLMHFDANAAVHHHLVCTRCGRIADAEIGPLPAAMSRPSCPHTGEQVRDWGLEGMQVELKGVCPSCL